MRVAFRVASAHRKFVLLLRRLSESDLQMCPSALAAVAGSSQLETLLAAAGDSIAK